MTPRLSDIVGKGVVAAWFAAGFVLVGTPLDLVTGRTFLMGAMGASPAAAPVSIAIGTFLFAVVLAGSRARRCSGNPEICAVIGVCGAPYMVCAARSAFSSDLETICVGANCARLLFVMALGLVAATILGNARDIAGFLVGLTTAAAVVAIQRYVSGNEHFLSGSLARASGSLGSPYVLMPCLALGLPFAWLFALRSATPLHRAVAIGCVVVTSVALVLTWYRSTTIVCAPVLIGMMARLKSSRRAIALGFCLFIAVAIISEAARQRGPSGLNSTEASNRGHLESITLGWRLFLDHPLIGVGIGRIRLPIAFNGRNGIPVTFASQPGCLPLYWLDLFGLFGAALAAASVVVLVRALRSAADIIAIGYGGALAFLFLIGLSSTPFGMESPEYAPVNAMLGLVLGGVALLRRRTVERRESSR